MKITNPFQLNDWEMKKFLGLILCVQLTMWITIGLDSIGFQIPIIRQLIGFIYLTFIPGVLVLRILRLHKIDNVETLLFSIGLSISLLMFTGFLLNIVSIYFNFYQPITTLPLIITLSTIV